MLGGSAILMEIGLGGIVNSRANRGVRRCRGFASRRPPPADCECVVLRRCAGHVRPAAATVVSVAWELGYLAILTVVLAVLFWNMAIGYLGALNAMLLGNLVPVVTFAIRIAQGHRFEAIELAGAGLVVAALIANNLYLRLKPGVR